MPQKHYTTRNFLPQQTNAIAPAPNVNAPAPNANAPAPTVGCCFLPGNGAKLF
ncbi:MAG: hypothetical protein ACM37W_08290 [Actinomycetota bacterium]